MEYPIENVTIIFNVKNMGWSNFDYSGSKEGAFILMNYYVERLGKLFFINMGWIFSTLYKIGKSWIDPETQTKFFFLKSNFLDTLKQYIDEDSIPKSLGGKFPDPKPIPKKKKTKKQLQEEKEKKEKEKKEKEKKEKEEKVNTNQKSKSFSSDKDNKHDSDDDSDDFESMQSDDEK
ncbi:phosphatidylinositol transfer protein csr1-related [Anaeramoeba ignava]|uniref:Phosphatidylinositol transfer protein csr1-related n=1 Tax=Anaeramoeba ignava TaxID=1746090 RepID=A0A9Q0LBB8_ANAIG|nr:phosphatidylinositol transfer protein csr1-related [Anaeramoeba ignava]